MGEKRKGNLRQKHTENKEKDEISKLEKKKRNVSFLLLKMSAGADISFYPSEENDFFSFFLSRSD